MSSSEGWVGVWLPIDNRIIATHALGAFVNKLGWTFDGAYLLATVGDELVVLSADGTARVATIATGHGELRTFAAHPSKPIVATTGHDGMVRLWELPSGVKCGEVLQKRAEGSGGGTALALSDGAIIVGYRNGYYGTCDPDGSNTGGGQVFGGDVASLALVLPPMKQPRSANFIAGGGRGRLAQLLITPDKMMVADTWSDPPKPIAANTIEFAPDGRFVVACSDDTACLFEGTNDHAPTRFGSPFWSDRKGWKQEYIVSAACFVPKTKLVATSHFTGCVKLWRTDETYKAPAIVRFEADEVKWDAAASWPNLE